MSAEYKITTEAELQDTLHWIERMKEAVESLKRDVLPKSKRWYNLMAEGPLDEIKRMQADVDDYLMHKGAAEVQDQIPQTPRRHKHG